ncbi:MAG: branched-chain amino acid ABC transporter permease, partial [Candidatus Diapherotrites archaeon]|nr:branched-chain amino acid ABC transporter permease [Candidatus Diapherotrites archaeon]
MIDAYFIHLLILIGIYLVLALSLQLAMGFSGLLNLGHMAFFAIGAYASALLALAGFPYWVCILAAGVFAALAGALLSIPTNRLKGDYLALATLGFSFVVYAIALNWTDLTRGPLGIPGIPRPEFLGFVFSDNLAFLGLTFFVCIATYLVLKRLTTSPFGTLLQGIRDHERAAQVLGHNTSRAKTLALATSAFFAGISGSLYAHYITFIDP